MSGAHYSLTELQGALHGSCSSIGITGRRSPRHQAHDIQRRGGSRSEGLAHRAPGPLLPRTADHQLRAEVRVPWTEIRYFGVWLDLLRSY